MAPSGLILMDRGSQCQGLPARGLTIAWLAATLWGIPQDQDCGLCFRRVFHRPPQLHLEVSEPTLGGLPTWASSSSVALSGVNPSSCPSLPSPALSHCQGRASPCTASPSGLG